MVNCKPALRFTVAVLWVLVFTFPSYAKAEAPQKDSSPVQKNAIESLSGKGLARKYRGDEGIAGDPDVVFTENFEKDSLRKIFQNWTSFSNKDDKVLAFSADAPPGSSGKRSMSMTATRNENDGGYLFKVISPGQDELYIRFYTKFVSDYGFCHHFVRIRGMIDPVPYPMGQISKEPSTRWCGTDIEPFNASQLNRPDLPISPPGIWATSSYWPEMRSWQGPGGNSFYPDYFEHKQSVPIPRNRWVCVEVMVKMNSSPEKRDGEQALWIDGNFVAHFGPGTVRGYWKRDKFVLDDEKGQPFEGFRWRQDMRLDWNRLWLLHYVSERAFKQTDTYASQHPDLVINTKIATVWFDDIVLAKKYIGPIIY